MNPDGFLRVENNGRVHQDKKGRGLDLEFHKTGNISESKCIIEAVFCN